VRPRSLQRDRARCRWHHLSRALNRSGSAARTPRGAWSAARSAASQRCTRLSCARTFHVTPRSGGHLLYQDTRSPAMASYRYPPSMSSMRMAVSPLSSVHAPMNCGTRYSGLGRAAGTSLARPPRRTRLPSAGHEHQAEARRRGRQRGAARRARAIVAQPSGALQLPRCLTLGAMTWAEQALAGQQANCRIHSTHRAGARTTYCPATIAAGSPEAQGQVRVIAARLHNVRAAALAQQRHLAQRVRGRAPRRPARQQHGRDDLDRHRLHAVQQPAVHLRPRAAALTALRRAGGSRAR